MSTTDKQKELTKAPWQRVLFYLGIAQILAGGGCLFALAKGRMTGPDWLRTAAFVILVVGGLLWYISMMPREQAVEWVKSGAFALVVALLIRWPLAEPYRIPSGSMETTLHGDPRFGRGDRVLVNKWVYGVRYPFMNKRIWQGTAPKRWDIVVFKAAEKNASHGTLVKRIVGMPGERVHIPGDGRVYINEEALTPPEELKEVLRYTAPPRMPLLPNKSVDEMMPREKTMLYGIRPEDEFSLIPEGHYLVLGDNSAYSRDGRYFGWLPKDHIVGRVAGIWWPPSRWSDFTGFSKTFTFRVLMFLLGLATIARLFLGRSWVVRRGKGRKLDHLFINFASLGLRLPFTSYWLMRWGRVQRGDWVLYAPQHDDLPSGVMLMGRVAGLPGEQVSFEDGELRINGEPPTDASRFPELDWTLKQPEAVYGRSKNKKYQSVPADHYFILSEEVPTEDEMPCDGRVLGWTPHARVLGKATFCWWPITRWRKL